MMFDRPFATLVVLATALIPLSAGAQTAPASERALSIDLTYKMDVMGADAGGGARDVAYLDDAELTASLALDRAIGWQGATAFVQVLNNLGGRPNDTAGTLQGVNNIEVGTPKLRLYQAWLQQNLLGNNLSVLIGRYDLNSEFYHNDAAGQLIGPTFGIGSELASTGPNGPSIFPFTDWAARLRAVRGSGYAQAAVICAPRGAIAGQRTALLIAEVGIQGRTRLALGGWTYTQRQPKIEPPGVTATLRLARSRGAYVLAEQTIAGATEAPGHWRTFVRAGVSDGVTSPFVGGIQVGIAGTGVLPSRPDSAVSFGFSTARLSDTYRDANPPQEPALARAENVFELTYSDRVLPFLTVQPDVQYILRPSGLRDADPVIVLGLRAILDWRML